MSNNVIKIISAGAPKLGVRRCIKFFKKNSDISVRIIFATAPEITKTGSDVIEYLDQSSSNHEIGFSQATEIQLKINEGMNVRLIGTLPAEIEHVSSYKFALLTSSANKKAARDMLHFMSSNEAKRICITSGLL